MNCREFERQLNHVLDERLAPSADANLAAHACDCSECDELLLESELLLHEVRCARDVPPAPEDLGERVLAEFSANSGNSWNWTAAILALAAAALVLVAVRPWPRDERPAASREVVVAPAPLPIPTPPAPEVQRAPSPLPADLPIFVIDRRPDRYQVFARVTTRMAGDLAAAGQQVWVEPLTDGIRPVRDSMSAAIDKLRPASELGPEPDSPHAPTTKSFLGRGSATYALV